LSFYTPMGYLANVESPAATGSRALAAQRQPDVLTLSAAILRMIRPSGPMGLG
jgi:hypothetical protein